MPRYDMAHIHEQGNDLIIIPLESRFGQLSHSDQSELIEELQLRCEGADLAGTVVGVWESGRNFYFISPPLWRNFFSSMNMRWVRSQINRYVSW